VVPCWPPRFRPEGVASRFGGTSGGSDEGGRQEFEEVWPSRASGSRTRACSTVLSPSRAVFAACRTAFSVRSAAFSCRSVVSCSSRGAGSGAGAGTGRSDTSRGSVSIMLGFYPLGVAWQGPGRPLEQGGLNAYASLSLSARPPPPL
jgi:hypothetical protein